jgi:hypothetical protein
LKVQRADKDGRRNGVVVEKSQRQHQQRRQADEGERADQVRQQQPAQFAAVGGGGA